MNKKWTLLLLAIVLLCSNVVFATKFSDVRGHWAESAITWSEEQSLLKGYEDVSFHSEKTITRAEWRKENSSWGNRSNSSSLGQRRRLPDSLERTWALSFLRQRPIRAGRGDRVSTLEIACELSSISERAKAAPTPQRNCASPSASTTRRRILSSRPWK